MSADLLNLYHTLEREVKKNLKEFDPEFQMSGSMSEGTRLGLANEVDIGLIFNSMKNNVAFKVDRDPFSLKKAETVPTFMEKYFNAKDEFNYHDFMLFLLNQFNSMIKEIFDKGMLNRSNRLMCVTTNKAWKEGKTKCDGRCNREMKSDPDTKFEQCTQCVVSVSQTKIGIALQFHWKSMSRFIKICTFAKEIECEKHSYDDLENLLEEGEGVVVYCSIDIIPQLPIEEIEALELARIVNRPMLSPNPPERWLRCLYNYARHYKIIQDLIQSDGGMINSIVLKTINFCEERNHYVRPAQPNTEGNKFQSDKMKKIYCCIKYLKKALDLDLSNYWVKNELLKKEYKDILDSYGDEDRALVAVLSQPEFLPKVEEKIDIEESNKEGNIELKGS